MEEQKRLVEAITPRDQDFGQWYTDIVKKADLAGYSSVKGCMIIRPYGYAIWENIQRILDGMFKRTGHENVYMPMFIPESLLNKEKDHVEGFAPEVAWVTQGGSERLEERLCVRPTSETLFCDHYASIIQSYRDLPKLYNQWCSVVRWEKTTRPFLRSREFLWQEGHTIHATAEEAEAETMRMLEIYAEFCENYLAIPVIKGRKTEREKFAGARATYCVEAMMHDGKALQAGTSHYFGDGFAKAFDIRYTDRDNQLKYPHQTSWGVSTRLIGGIIMVHGDDSGLSLPPAVAPIQAVIVPIAAHKGGVIERARQLEEALAGAGIRARCDEGDQSPGWKFAQYEMLGVPLRIELGPRDIEKGTAVLARRDSGEKTSIPLEGAPKAVADTLEDIQRSLYRKARAYRDERIYDCLTLAEFERTASEKPGFIRAMWCGSEECEAALRETAGVTSRCIPFDGERISDRCVYCGGAARSLVIWGKAY